VNDLWTMVLQHLDQQLTDPQMYPTIQDTFINYLSSWQTGPIPCTTPIELGKQLIEDQLHPNFWRLAVKRMGNGRKWAL